jgi:N4-gp56 family major capsid protein
MVANASVNFSGDISRYLDSKVLRLSQRHLVVRQFATKVKIPTNEELTYTATRFNRLPLPYAPLNEGVPPVGEEMSISQVTGVAIQWGDKVTVPDVANLTIRHPVVQQAIRLLGYQVPETYERNCLVQLTSGTQVNYVNQRGARANLVAGDVLDPTTVNRTVSNLKTRGAPMMNGPTETDVFKSIEEGPRKALANPITHEHYVAVGHPIPLNDFANNSTVQTAWSYSDINKLYINEVGQWRGMHFCESNMLPTWTGLAQSAGTPGTAGNLATSANYYVQVTGSDIQNQYESQIAQVSAAISVTGPTGSISVTVPSTQGFTYSIYIAMGVNASPMNLGLSASGPTTGPYAGQAVQIPPGTTAILTGIGLMQIPPAAPAEDITVFPMFVFGEDAFCALELERLTWTRLFEADKFDPLNQLRVVGWKGWDGYVITNQQFMERIESSASNTGAYP